MKSGCEEVQHLSICWYLKPWSDPFPGFQAREKHTVNQRTQESPIEHYLKVTQNKKYSTKHLEKNPSDQKQAERTSNGSKQCEEWEAKLQMEGWSPLSPCEGHINRQESIRSSNPDGRGKLVGTEFSFHLRSFLTSVYRDAIQRCCFQSSDGVQPACKCCLPLDGKFFEAQERHIQIRPSPNPLNL